MDLKSHVSDFLDFPKLGITFRDVMPLLYDPLVRDEVTRRLSAKAEQVHPTHVVGLDARGFLFGVLVADRLGLPFVPARKPIKLPGEVISVTYDLEYGSDAIEMQVGSIPRGARTLIVDDLLATGGTAKATATAVELLGGDVVGFAFVIELLDLHGRGLLSEFYVELISSLIQY